MNRQSFFSFSVTSQLALAFVIAVFVPITGVVILALNNPVDVVEESLQSFIAESGARRQQAIENDFRVALDVVDEFLTDADTLEAMRTPLRIFPNTPADRDLESRLQRTFNQQLLATPYFQSAWLLPVDVSQTYAEVGDLPFSRLTSEEQQSTISRIGQGLAERGTGERQALAYTERESSDGETVEPHVEIINLIYEEPDEDGDADLLGYFVADLDLDTIIRDNLAQELGQIDTYSFVILESGQYITTSDVRAENLVDLNSDAAIQAQSQQLTGVEQYVVGPADDRREVIGFFAPIVIEDETFALITETATGAITEQLASRLGAINFPVLVGGVLLVGLLTLALNLTLVSPLTQLRDAMRGIIRGDFSAPVEGQGRGDEVGALATTFVDMRDQIQTLNSDMQKRLDDRTRDLRVTQFISRTVTDERDLDKLMSRVVNLIVDNFSMVYHAQIFLIDSKNENAVLRASTGDVGQQLLQRGHKLKVGSISVIGQVTEQGQRVIARDTAESDVHRSNEFLSETRAELAIPLQLGDRIIGALDIQSKQSESFDDDLIGAMQSLADQITIAIENARLYEESERLLADVERDRREATQRAWQQYLRGTRSEGLQSQSGQTTDYDFSDIRRAVMQHGKPIVADTTPRDTVPFGVPVTLRGETLGVIECEVPASEFTYDRVLLAEELVNRFAISLDNARLFQESQNAADRERIVNEISTKLTGQTDIQTIIQTAIQEVGQALRTPQVAIRLGLENGNNGFQTDPKTQPIDNPTE